MKGGKVAGTLATDIDLYAGTLCLFNEHYNHRFDCVDAGIDSLSVTPDAVPKLVGCFRTD